MDKYNTIKDIINDLKENPIEKGGHIYHPIPFKEFKELKTSSNKKESYKKLNIILKEMNSIFRGKLKGKKVLDIGANAGLYSYSFSMKGMEIIAFEPNVRYSQIAEFLIREKKLNIKWFNKTFDKILVKNQKFDIAIMLSVFQWMAKGGENIEKAKEELYYISTKSEYLFFELGFNRGTSSIKTSKLNHYAELIRMLKENTCYKYFKLIGITELWKNNKRFLVICSNNEKIDDNWFRKLIRKIHI